MPTRLPAPVARRLAALLLLALFLAVAPCTVEAAHVLAFSPQGVVKQVRQVTARFSEPMVAFGDLRLAAPFTVECAEPGAGRWIDSRTWAYDFDRDLVAGVRCTFRRVPGVVSVAGTALEGPAEFSFSTGGPAVISSTPQEGNEGIDEEQAFVLTLDADAVPDSVVASVAFEIEGVAERVGVRLLEGQTRADILRSRYRETVPPHVLVVQARQRFPNRARVTLVWGRGVAAATGVTSEQDQRLPFRVRPEFTASFSCERENRQTACIPVTAMHLGFSAPVATEYAKRVTLVDPAGKRRQPQMEKVPRETVRSVTFSGPFPESTTFRLEVPLELTDDAGRRLANADRFPLVVRTDAFPPLAKFAARFGILERADPVLPVTLRNLEPDVTARMLRADGAAPSPPQSLLDRLRGRIVRVAPADGSEVTPWLRRVANAERERSVFATGLPHPTPREFSVPKPLGATAFEVVGIPLGGPGLYIVELESARLGASLLGKPAPMYVPTAALVTNLAVHFKWGREGSLAWVTALDTGRPVGGAAVSVRTCLGTTIWTGETDAQGLARMPALLAPKDAPRCQYPGGARWEDWEQTRTIAHLDTGLLVTAQAGDDFSFVHSTWSEGIEPWRFRLPAGSYLGPALAHTILDRSLLRAGETVHMKHLLRLQTLQGFAAVAPGDRPSTLSIRHVGSDQQYDHPVSWDAAGVAESTWAIPADAKLGDYEIVLPRGSGAGRGLVSGRFRVEEFRLPTMRGAVRLPPEPLIRVQQTAADVSLQYLAGGAASNLPVTVRTQIRPKYIVPPEEFEGFAFANGPVRQGTFRREQAWSDWEIEGDEEGGGGALPRKPAIHQRDEIRLDRNGGGRVTIARLPRATTPQEVLTEVEYRDPGGEVRTLAGTASLWPARWLVGIQPDSWLASRTHVKVRAAVVNLDRRPVAGATVQVAVLERKLYSTRKRLVGGFYAFEHFEEVRRLGELCRGETDARGRLTCEGKPLGEGNLVLQATVVDPQSNVSAAHQEVWVPGTDRWWFAVQDHDRMDVLPERPRYEPGETARLQVRMPFAAATALVTVEREGVAEAVVVPLSGHEPVVEIPVKGEHAPNVFVSVLAVRGRVGETQPTALVDLGRPAFKLGVAEIRVGWRAHALQVRVAPERAVYRVRETARVRVAVRRADGSPPPPGSEVAVAAVDEALLELLPNRSWSLLDSMMRRRGYEVGTASAQMQVVGKRHFGRKALPQGGGGGRQATRELFDTLLVWKARVPLDGRGEAVVDVPLNDSLTSVKVVAVASGGIGLFGTGEASLRTTQDLMLLAGVAPLVREGDRLEAEVTVRNASDRAMEVQLQGRVADLSALPAQAVRLAPGEASRVSWQVAVPAGRGSLVYEVEAREAGGASDRLRITQQVRAAVPVRTLQATLARWDGPLAESVARPADALPGRGGVDVAFGATLLAGLGGVRDAMADYPYSCLEQRVSQAVALRDEARWRRVVADFPAYLDSDGLLKYFASMRRGSEVLTAYALAIAHEAGWAIPAAVQARMEAGLTGFIEGKVLRRSALPTADLSIRKVMALEALSRYGRAAPRLLGSVALEPNLWPTSAVIDWWNVLHRVAEIPERAARLAEAERIVGARLNLQGTTMGFSTERLDDCWWLMVSADANALRLVLHLLEADAWRQDLPRVMRGAMGRQRRGAWWPTTANAWGVLAVEKFARAFERTPVSGVSRAALPGAAAGVDWSATPKGATVSLPWPAGREELRVTHEGTGHPWVTVASRAAVPLAAPLSSGYRITRSVAPVEQRVPGQWSRGDLMRVRLTVEAQSDMTWVVVSDPIPAGASHLGTGLGGDSQLAVQGEAREGWSWEAFAERSFEAFRAYYEYVPKGAFTVEYTIRLNASGRFGLPTTRVEALYAPEMFGELPNESLEVAP